MGSGDLNAKKSWHVVNLKNQKKVWESEQNALAERKRVNERLEELRKERQEEELAKQLEEAGGKRRVDRVDWMYQGPSSGDGGAMVTEEAEAFLLGKRRIDTLIKGDEHKQLEKSSIDDRFASTTGPSSIAPLALPSARDMATKIREDPLLAIKRQEQQALEAMANDPVRRRQMMAAAGIANKEKEEDRSRRSSHHHRSSRHRDGSRDRRRDRERERTRDRDDDDDRRHKRRRRDDDSRERRRDDSRERRRRDSRDRARGGDRDRTSRRDRDDRRRERSPRASSKTRSQSPRRDRDRSDRREDRDRSDRRDDRRDRSDRNGDWRNDYRSRDNRDRRPNGSHSNGNTTNNADEERARKLAAMQANASDLDTERSRRLAEIEAKEAAARAADDQARDKSSGSTTAFSTNLRQKVGDMGLADRLGRNRQGLQRDDD